MPCSNRDAEDGAAHRLLSLPEHELHLWLGGTDAAVDSDRFRRAVLSRYAAVSPDDWEFYTGPHGKPGITGDPGLAFNLSDSGQYVVCAVSAGSRVGVDIEYCDPDRQFSTLARRFFHPVEADALAVGDPVIQKALFYDFWTLKEARVKYEGGALAPALGATAFSLDYRESAPGRIEGSPAGELLRPLYCLFDIPGDYRLAVCWNRPPGRPAEIRLFHMPNERAVQSVPLALRATSDPLATGDIAPDIIA